MQHVLDEMYVDGLVPMTEHLDRINHEMVRPPCLLTTGVLPQSHFDICSSSQRISRQLSHHFRSDL